MNVVELCVCCTVNETVIIDEDKLLCIIHLLHKVKKNDGIIIFHVQEYSAGAISFVV